MKKEKKINKKVIAIVGVVLVMIIIGIVSIIMLMGDGTTGYAKKLKKYLEKVGYNCDGVYQDPDGFLDTDGSYIYCQMTSSNRIYKEVHFQKNTKTAHGVVFKNTVNNTYVISISGNDYASQKHKGIITYQDEIENHTFRYYAPSGDTFNIGDQVNCNDESAKYKEICEDNAKDVNAAMREFESYFVGAGITLK